MKKSKLNLSPDMDLRSGTGAVIAHPDPDPDPEDARRYRQHLKMELTSGLEFLLMKVPDIHQKKARHILAELAAEWAKVNVK